MMDPEKNQKQLPRIFWTLIAFFLISFAIFDFSIVQPNIRQNVRNVAIEFDSMKVFLDEKLPEIDSALVRHQEQIYKQTKQLETLNILTGNLLK